MYDMKVKILFLCLLFVVLCEVSSNSPRNAGTETQKIVASVQQAGGCCGVINENCGKCTPEGQMQGFEPGHGCCLPVMKRMEKKISGTGPQYWCCKCGYPNLQPFYGQPCCAGNMLNQETRCIRPVSDTFNKKLSRGTEIPWLSFVFLIVCLIVNLVYSDQFIYLNY